MKWIALVLLLANALAFNFFRADQNQEISIDLPRPVGSARLILIDELNFAERNGLRVQKEALVSLVPSANREPIADDFNLLRQSSIAESGALSDLVAGSVLEPDPELERLCEVFRLPEEQVSSLLERLRSVDLNPSLEEEVVGKPGPIMVYVPPFVSAREATLELNVLRREDIESFIIPEGDLQNGISVGVFGTAQNALARSIQLKNLGYQTDQYRYVVEETQYSVNLPLSESSLMASSYWVELELDFPSLTRRQNSCF
jgi:hypothetical protein